MSRVAPRFAALIALGAVLALSACARPANTVAMLDPSDTERGCPELQAELAQYQTLLEERAITRGHALRNDLAFMLAPVTAGYTLHWIDLYDTRSIEIDALADRYVALGTLAMRRGCRVQNLVSIDGTHLDVRLRLRNVDPVRDFPLGY